MSSCCLVISHVVQYSLLAHVHGPSDSLYLGGVETFWCAKVKGIIENRELYEFPAVVVCGITHHSL